MSASSAQVGKPVPVSLDCVAGQDPSGNVKALHLDTSGNLLVSGGGGGGGAVTVADGADVAEGSTADAAWSGSGAGTVVAVLKKIATAGTSIGAVTIADGADTAEGATTDAAVGDSNGTVNAHVRQVAKVLSDVWDSINHLLKVSIQNATLAVTQSGTWTTLFGGYPNAVWAVSHLPAANTQATITRATAGSSIKNVCLGFTATICAQATAPAAVQLSVALIDGASGGTTYLWRSVVSLPAVAGVPVSFVSHLIIPGSNNTAMTLEFSVAGGANTIESVALIGTTQ